MRFLVSLASAVVLVSGAFALPRPVDAANTHLGVQTGDIVLLRQTGTPPFPAGQGPVRVLSDGTNVNNFQIPDGHVLVITDLEWHVNTTVPPPTSVDVFIQLRSPAPELLTSEVYQARVSMGDDAFGYMSDHLTSPLVIDSIIDLDPGAAGARMNIGSIDADGMTVIMRGYLVRGGGRP